MSATLTPKMLILEDFLFLIFQTLFGFRFATGCNGTYHLCSTGKYMGYSNAT